MPPTTKVIASELNWARGPVILAGPLATGTVNKWQTPNSHTRSRKQMPPQLQTVPPFSAGIYSLERDDGIASASSASSTPVDPSSSSTDWHLSEWISSVKTHGKYGSDVHPLSIHRGNEGTLSPLVTTSSSDHRFIAFAQVPLITTVDGNSNFEPIEIVHLETDTSFTGLAFNTEGTILAVADNHQDIIILHRSLQAANQHKIDTETTTTTTATSSASSNPTSTPTPPTPTADGTPPSHASETESDSPSSPIDSSTTTPSTPIDASQKEHLDSKEDSPQQDGTQQNATTSTTPPPQPTQTPRKRHSWEVMMEVILPERVKHLVSTKQKRQTRSAASRACV